MSFPLYFILIPYLSFVLGWFVFCLIAIFHMLKFGFRSIITLLAVFIFIAGALATLAGSYGYVSAIDWSREATVLEGLLDFDIKGI